MDTRRNRTGLLLVAAMALAGRASPETPPSAGDPLLQSLIAEALRNNPDLSQSRSSSQAALDRVEPAKALPDPFLSLSYQNDGKRLTLGTRDMTFLGAAISQPLPWPGKLRLAGEIAASEARGVESGAVGRARRSIEARVRRSYSDVRLSRRLLDLIEERRAAWRQIEGIVRERYSAGLAVQQDLLRTQAEILRLDEARADEAARSASRLAELNRAVGRAQDAPLEKPAPLSEEASLPELAGLLDSTISGSPELAAAKQSLETARERIALSRKDFLPDFVASGGPMYRGNLDPMWQVGLGVTLPLFSRSRQRNRLREAEAQLAGAEAALSSSTQELELKTRERLERLKASVHVAGLYRDGVLPVDQLSLEAALASYRSGKVPFVTVLDAQNQLFADRSTYFSRLAEAEKLRAAIEEADLQSGTPMASGGSATSTMSASTGSPSGSPGSMR